MGSGGILLCKKRLDDENVMMIYQVYYLVIS